QPGVPHRRHHDHRVDLLGPRARPAHRAVDLCPRLSRHPGRDPGVWGLRFGDQSVDRPQLCPARSPDQLRMSATTTTSSLAATAGVAQERVGKRRIRAFNPLLVTGGAILAVVVFFCVVYPLTSAYSPTDPDFTQPTFAGPSWDHPLGTDNFGRDTL